MWSLMFLLALLVYLAASGATGWQAWLVTGLVAVWALRLAGYIAWRNHGRPEDHRYRTIRANNQPNFHLKSLYLVFGLQGFLAWVIVLPVLAAVNGPSSPGPIHLIGLALWLAGMFFEVVGDAQVARFRRRPGQPGEVLEAGLWRYTRHPNYFGECLIWWGYFTLALAAGGAWTVISPLLMTFLLLRVSGVALLERDIGDRRPAYRRYTEKTNAFFPGPPRSPDRNGPKPSR
jgi:steroid 5-alpha reductase family enzyme